MRCLQRTPEQPAGFIADLITPGYGSYFHEIIAVGDRQGDIEGKGIQKQINAQVCGMPSLIYFTDVHKVKVAP